MNIDEDDTKLFRLLEPGEFGIYTQSDLSLIHISEPTRP